MDSLGDKIEMIENDLRNGNTDTATQAVWQKNTGQVFLHEMMHLYVSGQPHSKPELIMRRSRLRSRALTNVKVNDESVEPEAGQHFATDLNEYISSRDLPKETVEAPPVPVPMQTATPGSPIASSSGT
jgi:hypothetical protein